MSTSSLSTRQRRLVLSGLLMGVFLAATEATVVATAMPTVIADLGGIAWYGWVTASYLLAATVTMPLYGRLSDTLGRKPVLLASLGLFLLGSLWSGFAQSIFTLIAARALQGLGAGGIQPVSMTIIGDLYTLDQRARIQALIGGVWGLAGALGPLLGGFIIATLTWHWVFWFNLPFGLAALALLVPAFKERRPAGPPQALDWQGAGLLALASGLLLLSVSGGNAALCFPLAVAFSFLFFHRERRAPAPLLPLSLFAKRHIAVGNGSSFFLGFLMMGALSFIPLYVQGVLGLPATHAGSTVAPMLIGWPIAGVITARLIRRLGFRIPLIVGSAIVAGGMLLMTAGVTLRTGPLPLAAGSFFAGAGLGISTTALILALQTSVAWELRGVVTASSMFARTMGSALGVGALGALLALLLSHQLTPEEIRTLLDAHGGGAVSTNAGPLAQGLAPLFWVQSVCALLNFGLVFLFPTDIEQAQPVAHGSASATAA